jgi:hypothetical protein
VIASEHGGRPRIVARQERVIAAAAPPPGNEEV